MTNPVTPNIGLNKIDRTSPSTTYFDLEKYIDQNADAVDQFAGETKQLDSLASRLIPRNAGRLCSSRDCRLCMQSVLHLFH